MRHIDFTIDGEAYRFPAELTPVRGAAETLFAEQDIFSGDAEWRRNGYAIVDLFTSAEIDRLADGLARRVGRDISELQTELDDAAATTAILQGRYHEIVASDEIHRQIVRRTANYRHEDLPIPVADIYGALGRRVQAQLSELNPKLATEIVTVRLSRPGSHDFNPPHRDVYLDFYRGTLNVWIPLAGCDERSTLPVVSGSHLWPENEVERGATGNLFNGLRFNVPIVFSGPQPLAFIRPRLKKGQALVFSPNLVHGAAINLNAGTTRMSLELRPVWSL